MFSGPFRAPFPSPITSPGTVVGPWYLAGGVAAADCVAAYQPIGAASLAASYINLINPGTNDAAPGVAPTHASASGWTFNGSTQWLNTGISRGSGYTMIVRVYSISDGVPMGGFDGRIVYMRARATDIVSVNGFNQIVVAPNATSTELVIGMAGMVCYRAGVTTGTIAGSDGGGSPISFGVAKTDHRFCACSIRASAVYSTTLTAAQMLAISTAMSALTG